MYYVTYEIYLNVRFSTCWFIIIWHVNFVEINFGWRERRKKGQVLADQIYWAIIRFMCSSRTVIFEADWVNFSRKKLFCWFSGVIRRRRSRRNWIDHRPKIIRYLSNLSSCLLKKMAKPNVVFVLGGPGAGKGTQCANIVKVRKNFVFKEIK